MSVHVCDGLQGVFIVYVELHKLFSSRGNVLLSEGLDASAQPLLAGHHKGSKVFIHPWHCQASLVWTKTCFSHFQTITFQKVKVAQLRGGVLQADVLLGSVASAGNVPSASACRFLMSCLSGSTSTPDSLLSFTYQFRYCRIHCMVSSSHSITYYVSQSQEVKNTSSSSNQEKQPGTNSTSLRG